MALIPADTGVDVLGMAEALVAVGRQHGERPVNLLNATHLALESVQHNIESIGEMTARGEWVIVAVDPVVEHPGAVAIVRATSAALLVVRLGQSFLASARTTIDLVGREHFLGTVVVKGTAGEPSSTLVAIDPIVPRVEESDVALPPSARRTRIAAVACAAVAIAGLLILGPSVYRQLRGEVAVPALTRKPAAIPETRVGGPQSAPVTSSIPITDLETPSSSLPIVDSYLLVVASFKTEQLADRLATTFVDQGLPAFVRHQNGWSQVIIGPYLTSDEAREIQGQLEPVTFADAHIVRERAATAAAR